MAARLAWASGAVATEDDIARVEAFEDLADIDLESMNTFYEVLGDKVNAVRTGRAALRHFEREDDDGNDNTA